MVLTSTERFRFKTFRVLSRRRQQKGLIYLFIYSFLSKHLGQCKALLEGAKLIKLIILLLYSFQAQAVFRS